MGKAENAGYQHFHLFPTMFSTLSKRNFTIHTAVKLSSANAFNLEKVNILSSGQGIMHHTDVLNSILTDLGLI